MFGEFEYEHVCRFCYILRCWLYGARTATAGGRSGRIRSRLGIFSLSIGCTTTARVTVMGMSVLLYAAADRFGFTVLYDGRIYNSRYWWMAQIAASPQRDFHCHCLLHQLFSWLNVYYAGLLLPSKFIYTTCCWFVYISHNFVFLIWIGKRRAECMSSKF